ncbi:MAG: HisA/HisF-related TIM barrel protein [Candidatus Dormibacteraceae bacterium]
MELIPAIDLIEGRVVRLFQGDLTRVTVYPAEPVALALSLVAGGATRLHVIDLEGAFAGGWRNLDAIRAIAAAVTVPIQAGGGARDLVRIRAALAAGVDRVIVGTAAVESVEKVKGWAAELGPSLVVSLDSRGGEVLSQGWRAAGHGSLLPLATELRAAGVQRLVHTDIRRDGTLRGADLAGLRELRPLGLPVLVAGGVTTYRDLEVLREEGAEGAIVGRALLEGRLALERGLAVAAGAAAV